MAKKNLFVFLGAYASEADARADYEVIKELHDRGHGRHLRRGGGDQGRRRQGPRQQGRAAHPPRRLDRHRGRRRARHHLPPVNHRHGRGRRRRRRRDRAPVARDVAKRRQGARRGPGRRRGGAHRHRRLQDRRRDREGPAARRSRRSRSRSTPTPTTSSASSTRPRSRSDAVLSTFQGDELHDVAVALTGPGSRAAISATGPDRPGARGGAAHLRTGGARLRVVASRVTGGSFPGAC